MEVHLIFNIPTILKDGHLQVLESKYVFHYPIFSMREKLSLDQRNIMNESPSSECFSIKVKIPYAHHYKPRFVYFLPPF